jgi:Xaa-Pro aminopeptidase
VTTAARRAALLDELPDDVDGMLVTNLVNVRYLTGFTGSNGAVLVSRNADAVLATDGRYQIQAAAQSPDVHVLDARSVATALVQHAATAGVRRLAIERSHVTLSTYDALSAAAGEPVELVDAGQPVEQLRVVKDDDELAALQRACAATDAAFADVLPQLRPGVTEREIAWALLGAMRVHGADGPSFESIVAFGTHSAIPHHEPTDRPLARGDLVKLDFGALVDGYHADMTRTVVCGRAADWQRDLHALVAGIQARCADATVEGAEPAALEQMMRTLIGDTGNTVAHGLGHGVGLEIHEQPFLVHASPAARLVARVPVTVEPGIYLPGQGGVRVEDTVLVGAGGAEPLTTSPRDLLEI